MDLGIVWRGCRGCSESVKRLFGEFKVVLIRFKGCLERVYGV